MSRGRPKNPEAVYEGTPCARAGHTLRYKNSNSCVECERLKSKNPEVIQRKREASARHRSSPNNTVKLRYLKRRYGLSVGRYKEMEKDQEGLCKICHKPPHGRWNRLHVDHDHKTGKVRGLLCFACNSLLGLAEDNIETLRSAIKYLSP